MVNSGEISKVGSFNMNFKFSVLNVPKMCVFQLLSLEFYFFIKLVYKKNVNK